MATLAFRSAPSIFMDIGEPASSGPRHREPDTMYKRILLAADGAPESLQALREGALIAKAYRATVYLLIIDRFTSAARVANGVYPISMTSPAPELLERGLARLSRLDVVAKGSVAEGDAAMLIGKVAREFRADLVVVGHRRQSLLERWWSGSSGAYLTDQVACSVLLARNIISDEEFEAYLQPDAAT
jgi:nucleotide-binding universal stress UspA family protein